MKNSYAPKSAKKNFLIMSLFLVLCLPLIVWQVVNEDFDWRDLAFQEVEVSEENPCVISFPNVNPYTLEVGSTVRMQIEGISQASGITSVAILNRSGETVFSKEYDNSQEEIVESFEFTPTQERVYDLSGSISEGEYDTACVISSPYDVKGIRAVANNSAPEFTSSPLDSKPSQDIDTGVGYEYILTATDPENDFINYTFSFTPNNQWLKYNVIENGNNGKLKIQFKGSTSEPASYLANVFIHDGYSKHLRSQSWIVSVNPAENDVPKVTIISPWEAISIEQGKPLTIKWGATDRNAITNYELYMAQSLQDEDSWKTIDDDIPYNVEEYTFNTSELSAGLYKAVIKAPDNQDPPLVGRGISPQIEIIGEEVEEEEEKPDDQVEIPEPQIINVSPTEEDIKNRLITIRASLLASENAEINVDSIKIKLDGEDITPQAKFNKISESEFTLIYQTEEEYEGGLHKVEITFEDTEELQAEKSWTFNITADQRDPDKFYIFGYGISKLVVYVIAGGLLLLILSLIVPLILVRVWREDEETVEEDNTLIPPEPRGTVENIVNTEQEQKPAGVSFAKLEDEEPESYYFEQKEDLVVKEKAGGDIKKKIIEAKEKKDKESSVETVPDTTTKENDIPEPDEDLLLLYQKINKSEEDKDESEE
ncbi:MAG: transmembrane(s)protein [candidate division WS6 bacterium 34_10]|uniref:Transmembrane(S)protein n=1 Tax=candidate division WS6 bacterium 34_10 TaxID=1641389 RepID=A0A101HIB7_9BACT|nr:MAG: transmembrane(s)protein [candidate division WS6 bacterium 34_10]